MRWTIPTYVADTFFHRVIELSLLLTLPWAGYPPHENDPDLEEGLSTHPPTISSTAQYWPRPCRRMQLQSIPTLGPHLLL